MIDRVTRCANKLQRWGKKKMIRFKEEIDECVRRMNELRGNQDEEGSILKVKNTRMGVELCFEKLILLLESILKMVQRHILRKNFVRWPRVTLILSSSQEMEIMIPYLILFSRE